MKIHMKSINSAYKQFEMIEVLAKMPSALVAQNMTKFN